MVCSYVMAMVIQAFRLPFKVIALAEFNNFLYPIHHKINNATYNIVTGYRCFD